MTRLFPYGFSLTALARKFWSNSRGWLFLEGFLYGFSKVVWINLKVL